MDYHVAPLLAMTTHDTFYESNKSNDVKIYENIKYGNETT